MILFFLKIVEPIVGFKKAFIIEGNKWSKIKEFEVTDSSYILKNIYLIRPNVIIINVGLILN